MLLAAPLPTDWAKWHGRGRASELVQRVAAACLQRLLLVLAANQSWPLDWFNWLGRRVARGGVGFGGGSAPPMRPPTCCSLNAWFDKWIVAGKRGQQNRTELSWLPANICTALSTQPLLADPPSRLDGILKASIKQSHHKRKSKSGSNRRVELEPPQRLQLCGMRC